MSNKLLTETHIEKKIKQEEKRQNVVFFSFMLIFICILLSPIAYLFYLFKK